MQRWRDKDADAQHQPACQGDDNSVLESLEEEITISEEFLIREEISAEDIEEIRKVWKGKGNGTVLHNSSCVIEDSD